MKNEQVVDEKLEKLLTAYTEDYFYAKVNSKFDDKLVKDNKIQALDFTYDIEDCESFEIKVKSRSVSGICLKWCTPGIKGILAFFYALERGYGEIYLDEYDYYDAYMRCTIQSNKVSQYARIIVEEYCGRERLSALIIDKAKTIANLKKVLKDTFTDENLLKIGPEVVSNYIEKEGNINEEDVEVAERFVEEWNFARSLKWLYSEPQSMFTMKDFLDDEYYENYLKWKKAREELKEKDARIKDLEALLAEK